MAADRQSSTMVVAATPAPDDNNHLFLDILHEAPLFGHRKPTSILGSIFYCILLVMLFLLLELHGSFILKQNWFHLCSVAAMSFFWSLQGYYVFSQKLKHVIRLPFAFISYGTVAMLLIHVWKPNISILSSLQYSGIYHEGGRLSDQQMALLQHQRENIHFLNEAILKLQECLSKCKRSDDGSTPQVDLAHLLAARDQELRTVSAEMNQVQSELSLARSLIAERDSELQHVRSTNNQYIVENERLRAVLGEWSTRAAKLERTLEAEWLSNLDLRKKLATTKS